MNHVRLAAWIVAVSLPLLSSCSDKTAAKTLPTIRDDCTEWCEPAWEEADAQQVCMDACREYVDQFKTCASAGRPCTEARICAVQKLKQACSHLGEYASVCEDSGRFAHNLMLQVCTSES